MDYCASPAILYLHKTSNRDFYHKNLLIYVKIYSPHCNCKEDFDTYKKEKIVKLCKKADTKGYSGSPDGSSYLER